MAASYKSGRRVAELPGRNCRGTGEYLPLPARDSPASSALLLPVPGDLRSHPGYPPRHSPACGPVLEEFSVSFRRRLSDLLAGAIDEFTNDKHRVSASLSLRILFGFQVDSLTDVVHSHHPVRQGVGTVEAPVRGGTRVRANFFGSSPMASEPKIDYVPDAR